MNRSCEVEAVGPSPAGATNRLRSGPALPPVGRAHAGIRPHLASHGDHCQSNVAGFAVAQAFAGHSASSVTGTYTRARIGEVAAAVSALTGEGIRSQPLNVGVAQSEMSIEQIWPSAGDACSTMVSKL